MKQFEDIFKERLEGYEMKLPASDRDAFLNRKATREHYARRRRTYISIAVGIPAAAAIIMGIMLSISLLSKQDIVPSNQQQFLAAAPKVETPAPSTEQAEYKEETTHTQPDETINKDTNQATESVADNYYVEDDYIEEDIMVSVDDIIGLPLLDDFGFIEVEPDSDEYDFLMWIDKSPEFPGGTNALLDYLKKNMIYPDSCRNNNIQGRVIVTLTIEKDGSVSNPRVVKSAHPLLDTEAVRLVTNMPKWEPAEQKGKKVQIDYSIPVNFKLD